MNSMHRFSIKIQFVKSQGFSLIELMIALAIGLLLSGGIIFLFSSTSRVSTSQDAVARLQENGRYAMSMIMDDLRMARGQYCSNSGGIAVSAPSKWQDSPTGPRVFAVGTGVSATNGILAFDFNNNVSLVQPGGGNAVEPYVLHPRFFMQGYECTNPAPNMGVCNLPALNGFDLPGTVVPNQAGITLVPPSRSRSGDLLTIRYLNSPGWQVSGCATATTTVFNLTNPIPAADVFAFQNGDLAMVADCSTATIFNIATPASGANAVASAVVSPTPGQNFASPTCPNLSQDARLFNFSRGFVTVTYLLDIAVDPNPDAPANTLISRLIRRVNGQNQVIADGVERLDFVYLVEDNQGNTRFLNADQVNSITTPGCPPSPEGINTNGVAAQAGCAWAAVKAVEVHLLLNTVNDIPLDASEQRSQYMREAAVSFAPGNQLPSGLPAGRKIRREFVSTIGIRNYNQ